jgi:hypothetical protein
MSDLRSRLPAQALMERTLELHPSGPQAPRGEALSWYRGALGEIVVGGVLGLLGPEWTVLHSVPVGSGSTDIDHVVIGPAGVFTLNTKSHPGQELWVGGYGLLVSGQKTNYINRAADEAARAEELLTAAAGLVVPVTPVIVLVNPGPVTVRSAPERSVQVVADSELLDLIRGRQVFSQEQLERIVATAVLPGTWHRRPEAGQDGRATQIQFNAIIARALQGTAHTPVTPRAPGAPVARRVEAPAMKPANPRSPYIGSESSGRAKPRGDSRGTAIIKVLAVLGGTWVAGIAALQVMFAAVGR